MNKPKQNEVAPEQCTPQLNSQVADVNSAPATNDNCTTDNNNSQVTNDTNIDVDTLRGIVKDDPRFITKLKVARDLKFECEAYDNNKQLKIREVAERLVKEYHIIKLNDLLHIYSKGIYVNDISSIETLIRHKLPKAKPVEVKSILSEISSSAPNKVGSSYRYVAFKNRIVDILTLKDFEFDADKYIITSRINAVYKADFLDTHKSYVKFVLTYFDKLSCGNKELATLYLEILFYCLLRTHNHQRGFLLKGSSFNGKSIFLKVIERLSDKYCSHLNLEQLSTPKSLEGLYHCTVNIIDDTGEPKKLDLELLQSVVSGFTIELPRKDNGKFTFESNATLIMATTKYLTFKDFNKSLTRRFVVVPFYADFRNNRDDNIEEEILKTEHLSVIAIMALQAYNKVLVDGDFHIPQFVSDETKAYFNQSNPLLEFMELHPIKRLFLRSEYLSLYEDWCVNTKGLDKPNRSVVGKAINNLGYKTNDPSINGIRQDYYFAPDYNIQKFREEYDKYSSSLEEGVSPMKELDYLEFLNKQDKDTIWKELNKG